MLVLIGNVGRVLVKLNLKNNHLKFAGICTSLLVYLSIYFIL